MAFTVTPVLGVDAEKAGAGYYSAGQSGHSPQLGATVTMSNGRLATRVTAAAALTAEDRVNINYTTFVATANATGTHAAPVDVALGQAFWAEEYKA